MTDQPTRALATTPAELGDGRFVTGELLGQGGMAVVVSAEDTLLDRTVAVKLLSESLAHEPDARERFSREARSMAALNHPNVVQVYDVGEVEERPYFIMEYVAGGSLADRLKAQGPLPPEEVDRVALESLRGLAHAHEAGLLHRDLKPANLLVASDGTIKVTDFGVARAAESQTLTRTGIVLGTMRYLAPERLRGESSTEASDLYGLAATLYELVTAAGVDPKKDNAPLRRLPQDMPGSLRIFLERGLAEDPRQRPASAAEALSIWDTDRDRTQSLPTMEAPAPTAPVDPEAPTRSHPLPGESTAGPARAGGRTGGMWSARRGWLLVGLAVVALLAALTAISDPGTTADDTTTPATGEDAGGEPAGDGTGGDGTVPPGATPEETARNLAEWLRDLGD